MRTRVFVPFSAYLRVVLTGMSAALAVTLGAVLATAAQAAPLVTAAPVSYPVTASASQLDLAGYRTQAAVSWEAGQQHAAHLHHVQYQAQVAAQAAAARAAAQAAAAAAAQAAARAAAPPPPPASPAPAAPAPQVTAAVTSGGVLTAAEVGELWLGAGGPSWAEPQAVEIAYCESGFNPDAYNPSGATGIWQILGSVVPGDLTSPSVNAANAVAKFTASGGNFSAWVCQ